jgi:hypothetical protein
MTGLVQALAPCVRLRTDGNPGQAHGFNYCTLFHHLLREQPDV